MGVHKAHLTADPAQRLKLTTCLIQNVLSAWDCMPQIGWHCCICCCIATNDVAHCAVLNPACSPVI